MDTTATEVFARHESQVRSYCRDFPLVIERALGPYVWDTGGRRYVDLLCGAGALNYGHNHPEMVARVTEYLARGGPVQSLDLHTTAKAEFMSRIATDVLAPRGMDHVMQFPGPAGTLAVEAALKLARQVTGRTNVIAFTGGFHGVSLGSLSATSNPTLRRGAGVPLHNVTMLPYERRLAGIDSSELLDHMLRPSSGMEPPAAILLESVQGEGGLHVASPGWLRRVQRLAQQAGALLVLDDIQAGCGRTGTMLSTDEILEFDPDIVCQSKSLSGMGLPMAMLLIRRHLDQWEPGGHNATFRGHNLAFVAGVAALDLWRDGLGDRVAALGEAIGDSLRSVAAAASEVGANQVSVAGRGAMRGLRFASSEQAGAAQRGLYDAGVIAETCGGGTVLKFFPPITTTVAEWEGFVGVIGDVVLETARSVEAGSGQDVGRRLEQVA
ncbi:diaminobutyrate--2-oxoglutarate transaminase [Nocardioides plantarum]|uniref:Diaminobutyrate--2-oxoglutarate transaminase n=1 Tax=Nocardioides plantarum TaxID=29299 RepID=A0ABV5KAX0_9ACTN|nr:diaminobutyrate--2-oxoglutarate transaminase [Nocardioides plantarum]